MRVRVWEGGEGKGRKMGRTVPAVSTILVSYSTPRNLMDLEKVFSIVGL